MDYDGFLVFFGCRACGVGSKWRATGRTGETLHGPMSEARFKGCWTSSLRRSMRSVDLRIWVVLFHGSKDFDTYMIHHDSGSSKHKSHCQRV